jgi:hypothetical protein
MFGGLSTRPSLCFGRLKAIRCKKAYYSKIYWPKAMSKKRVSSHDGHPFRIEWLPGTDSNRRLSGYKCPGISTRLGLSHHPSLKPGVRVSGASPPSLSRRVRAKALVSAPSLNNAGSGLGSGLPFSAASEGQASLNSPDFSTTISRGSCVTQPPALPTELPGSILNGI